MNHSELPAISIILTGHNEEYCIGDAIRSVFCQDYEGPVEIILSDDGSSDGTFAMMQEMASRYHGPYHVVLNRNETSLGRGPHIRKALGLASHEWILRQDGDDCSFPWRCRIFAQAVMDHPDAVAVFSQLVNVYEEPGEPFHFPPFPVIPEGRLKVVRYEGGFSAVPHYGGGMMMRRDAYLKAADRPMTEWFEDDLFALYGWMQGHVYELKNMPLYYYRFAAKNICAISNMFRFASLGTAREFESRECVRHARLKASRQVGQQVCREVILTGEETFRSCEELQTEIEDRQKSIEQIDHFLNWWNYPFRQRWKLRRKGWVEMMHCLPRDVYLCVMVVYFKLRGWKRKLFKNW